MYNIIKKALPLIFLLTLCGCSSTAGVTYLDKSYHTETVTVDLLIPQFTGLKDNSFQDTVNREIEDICGEFLNKFKTSAEKTSHPSSFTAETRKFDNGSLVSLITDICYNTEIPYNNSYRIAKTINTSISRELELSDLFADSGYIDFINHSLDEMITNNPEVYSDLWAKPVLSENQTYYITNDSLVIFYPPYELSYYTRGFVEFSIPLPSLSGYLTEEYRQILIKKS